MSSEEIIKLNIYANFFLLLLNITTVLNLVISKRNKVFNKNILASLDRYTSALANEYVFMAYNNVLCAIQN